MFQNNGFWEHLLEAGDPFNSSGKILSVLSNFWKNRDIQLFWFRIFQLREVFLKEKPKFTRVLTSSPKLRTGLWQKTSVVAFPVVHPK